MKKDELTGGSGEWNDDKEGYQHSGDVVFYFYLFISCIRYIPKELLPP